MVKDETYVAIHSDFPPAHEVSTMTSTNYWQKTRFFHDLSASPPEEEQAAATTATATNAVSITSKEEASDLLSPVYQLHAIAMMNDRAVQVLQDGQTGLALHFFGAALSQARQQISAADANASRIRNVAFSELLIIPSSLSSTSSSSSSASSSLSTTTTASTTSHYLVPLPWLCGGDHHLAAGIGGGDSGAGATATASASAVGGGIRGASSSTGMFAKAILLCHSPFPATIHTLIDTLQFHQGLCRHIQALECYSSGSGSGGSANRRDVLYRLARQRYNAVLVPPLVRAAARCNLLLCSENTNGDITTTTTTTTTTMEEDRNQQAFIDACQDLQDPAEIAEFRHCIHHAARAA
jgi:hypothetical protein